MSKIKMRCITCGKWFQSANAKEVTCPDCTQKARKEKLAAKNAPSTANKGGATTTPRVVAPPPAKQKSVQSGTNQWLDSLEDVKIAEPEPPPPPRPKILPPSPPRDQHQRGTEEARAQATSPAGQREEHGQRRENFNRGQAYREEGRRGPGNYRPGGPGQAGGQPGYRPGGYRPGGPEQAGGQGPRPRLPMEGKGGRGPRPEGAHSQYKPKPRPKGHGPKPAAPPKPKREKIPPPEPFTPTEEQIKQVEERYIELATPAEFDGIRTQIAQELSIPKKAVKKIIKDLRDNQHIPSWWENQTYKGSSEELERIKTAYLPYLPVPQVGIHKKIADELDLKPGIIYQAIKSIRLEMNLPQYNDPAFHEEELAAIRLQRAQRQQERQRAEENAASATSTPEAEKAPAESVAVAEETSATSTPEAEETPAESVAVAGSAQGEQNEPTQ
jgi:predicted  nucleic acid-binding Zn-ribbon protein